MVKMDMIWEFINPSNDYLSAIIGMIMSIIALALPKRTGGRVPVSRIIGVSNNQ